MLGDLSALPARQSPQTQAGSPARVPKFRTADGRRRLKRLLFTAPAFQSHTCGVRHAARVCLLRCGADAASAIAMAPMWNDAMWAIFHGRKILHAAHGLHMWGSVSLSQFSMLTNHGIVYFHHLGFCLSPFTHLCWFVNWCKHKSMDECIDRWIDGWMHR